MTSIERDSSLDKFVNSWLIYEKGFRSFQIKLNDSKEIRIALSVLKNEVGWQVDGKVVLIDSKQDKIKAHVIKPIEIEKGEFIFIGSYLSIFEVDGVTHNIAETIPPDDLDNFANSKLAVVVAYNNGVEITSALLNIAASNSVEITDPLLKKDEAESPKDEPASSIDKTDPPKGKTGGS